MKYRIGYFAVEGYGQMTYMHIVDEKDKPVCGCRVSRLKWFHWCANVNPGDSEKWLSEHCECSRCVKKMRQINGN